MKKLLIGLIFLSTVSLGQVTPDGTIKSTTNSNIRISPLITGVNEASIFDMITNSKLSLITSPGYLPIGNSSGYFTGVPLSGDGTMSSAGSLSVLKLLGNTIPANASGALTNDGSGTLTWTPAGGGSVTSLSVATANGFGGTFTSGATPILTVTTTTSGMVKGNGSGALVNATSGTDYQTPLSLTTTGGSGAATFTSGYLLNIPTPTLAGLGVSSTTTQLNYLNAATGTTGTTSTNLVFSGTPTITTPVLTGLPTGSGVSATSTASTLMSRDANVNTAINNSFEGYATTATAAGTTTLTISSASQQFFTGSTTQTVLLPVVSTLPQTGIQYYITNLSSGSVTVQSSGANTIQVMAAQSYLAVTCISLTGTGTASWSFNYEPNINSQPLPIVNGGTGTTTPALVAGTNVTITGSWPNQTINSSGGGGSSAYPVTGTGTLTGAVTIAQGTYSTTITGTPTLGNFVFNPSLANGGTLAAFVIDGSGTEPTPWVLQTQRTDFNTVSDNVVQDGFNINNSYDATKPGWYRQREYRYAASSPSDWFLELHEIYSWPSSFGSGSTRVQSFTMRQGSTLALSSCEIDYRATVINWLDLNGNGWAGMSPGSFQIGNTANTYTVAFLSDPITTSSFKIYPYAGTYTNGLDMSLWSTVALGGLTFTSGTIYAGSTGAITLTNNTATNPIAVNTTAGFTFTGSGTQTFFTGISAATTRAYESVNFSTGEVRHFAGTGGYYHTFYANNAVSMELASDGSVQLGGRVHIALSVGTSPTGAYLDFGNSGTATAYIRFPTGGSLLTTPAAGSVEVDPINLYYTPSGTTRKVVNCSQVTRSTAQTGAVASVTAWTVGANDGSFKVSANVLVTASTTHAFTVTCTYTDEGNTSRTATLNFQNVGGTVLTSIANAGGAVPYLGLPLEIRCKAATTITIATTGVFTSVTYNVEGSITQIL